MRDLKQKQLLALSQCKYEAEILRDVSDIKEPSQTVDLFVKQFKPETLQLFPQNTPSQMLNYVLNTPLSLVVNEVWVDEELISLMHMKTQQKIKALLNSTDAVNVELWTKTQSACVAANSKLWNTLNYWV